MFFELPRDIASAGYADGNTPYTYYSNLYTVLNNLQEATEKFFQWFSANYLVANADKCYLLTSSKTVIDINILDVTVSNEKRIKLLGINLEGKLNFDIHLDKLIKMVSKKCHPVASVSNYMDSKERRVLKKACLMNAFKSQFSYCSLVWVFHSSTLNNKINRLFEQ